MAETIRDVVIRTRLEMVGNDPMRAHVEEAKRALSVQAEINARLQETARLQESIAMQSRQAAVEAERAATAIAKASAAGKPGAVGATPAVSAAGDPMRAHVESAKRAKTAHEEINAKLRDRVRFLEASARQDEKERKHLQDAIRHREKLVALERQRAVEAERVATATGKASAAGAGGGSAAAGPAFFKAGQALSVASAVITVLNAPKMFLPQIAGLVGGLGAEFRGGAAADDRGPFTAPGREFAKELGISEERLGNAVVNGLKGLIPGFGALLPNVFDERNARREQAPAFSRMDESDRAAESIQRAIALHRQLADAETMLIRKQLDAAKMATKEAEQRFETIKKSVDAAKEEFGLMDRSQQQTALNIAKQIKEQGIGSLNQSQFEFAQRSQAFKGILGEHAQQNADASGFAKLLADLGVDRKLQVAEAEVKATLQQQNAININIEGQERIIEDLTAKLLPILNERNSTLIAEAKRMINQSLTNLKANASVPTPNF